MGVATAWWQYNYNNETFDSQNFLLKKKSGISLRGFSGLNSAYTSVPSRFYEYFFTAMIIVA